MQPMTPPCKVNASAVLAAHWKVCIKNPLLLGSTWAYLDGKLREHKRSHLTCVTPSISLQAKWSQKNCPHQHRALTVLRFALQTLAACWPEAALRGWEGRAVYLP